MDASQKPLRVLTLDGGGMRGLYTAQLLQLLAERFNSKFKQSELEPDIGKSFDLICGTSTGAILACALAAGISIKEVIKLYINNGPLIFPYPKPNKKFPKRWSLANLKKPSSRVVELRKALDSCIGNITLGELYKKRNIKLCIPTINAITYKARAVRTGHRKQKTRDDNYKLVDICLASAAAPIYFPLHKMQNPDNENEPQYFVDGGLWANNPVLCGIIEALVITDETKQPIELISIGTCDTPSGDLYSVNIERGLLDWSFGVKIIEMAMSAQAYGYSGMATLLAKSITQRGQRVEVIRLENSDKSPEQYSAIGLDRADKKAIDTLVSFASTDVDHIHSKVNNETHYGSSIIQDIFSNIKPISSFETTVRRH